MIPLPSGVRVWLATGHTDMRKGWASLALQVQEVLAQDPHSGNLFIFRGRHSDLIKVIWPGVTDGAIHISAAQLGYLLEGIDWRLPQKTWRPEAAG